MNNIIEIKYIQEALPYIATRHINTLVLFDIDDVLINTTGDFGGFRWWEHNISDLMQKGITREEAINRMNHFYVKLQPYLVYTPIEKTTVATFTAIKQLGVSIMGLTGRAKESAELTYKELGTLGIEFPSNQSIIFCNSLCKGDALKKFLSSIPQQPAHIIFIDDFSHNIDAVGSMLQQSYPNITFTGLFYSHIKSFTTYDPARANAEWRAIEDKHGAKLSL